MKETMTSLSTASAILDEALSNWIEEYSHQSKPLCDICHKPIRHSQFDQSAATLNKDWFNENYDGRPSWRLTHNDCEPSIEGSCFDYWIGLDVLGTPAGIAHMTQHLRGHIGESRWQRDVVARIS